MEEKAPTAIRISKKLTTDFVDAIKTSNWQEIERINNSVLPDLSSLEYMQSHGFIMEKIVGDKDLDTFLTDNRTFHLNLLRLFHQELERESLLEGLKLVKIDDLPTKDDKEETPRAQPFLIFESGNRIIHFDFGDLYKIDGNWKTVTVYRWNNMPKIK